MNSEVQAKGEENNAQQAQPLGRLRTRLIKGAVGSFGLQVGFAGLAFLNAIVLARVLGAEGYGAFSNAMAWISLLTIPATFGFGILLVRDTAIYRSQGKWTLLKGLLRFSNRIVLVLSIVLALSAAVLAGFLFSSPTQTLMRHTVWIALGLLPLFSMYNLREATLRGLEHVIYARLPGMIVRPGLLFVGIVSIYYFWPARLSAPAAMAVNVGSGVVALTLGVLFLHKLCPREAKEASSEYTPRPWLKAAFPMMVYGGGQIVLGQTDIVMLGAMRGAHEVGLYTAANRLAFLITYVLIATNIIMTPMISRIYAMGDIEYLQKIVMKSVRIVFLITLPFGLFLIFYGEFVLQVFGHEFVASYSALVILSIGQMLNLALGPYAPTLSMTGFAAIVAIVTSAVSLINIILNAALIPIFGSDGAAMASVISMLVNGCILSVYAVKKAHIETVIFAPCLRKIL